jgi:hypothetical protein
LNGRIDIHSAAYGNCSCGHAWLTLDGNIIANFCTRAKFIRDDREPGGSHIKASLYNLADFGEFSRQDAYAACWAFVHDLSIDQALEDSDSLVNCLAVLDARLGKRRLAAIKSETLHPLAARLFSLRLEAEGLSEAA